jgi:hypothetical protein
VRGTQPTDQTPSSPRVLAYFNLDFHGGLRAGESLDRMARQEKSRVVSPQVG